MKVTTEEQRRHILLLRKQKLEEMLPFLPKNDNNEVNAHKIFPWQKEFIFQVARMCLLTAANQIGKSTGAILKNIILATCQDMWAEYFPERKPKLFWYFYPNKKMCRTEFEQKWIDYLPKGEMRTHPKWGWKVEYDKEGYPDRIYFNSGVTLMFLSYEMRPKNLQGSTLDMVTGDEEMPKTHYDELKMRLRATKGIFNLVFTATLGQMFWAEAIEMVGTDRERFVTAFKKQISMYDCLKYADGSTSHITEEDIQKVKDGCSSEGEILKRVYGRFVRTDGLRFPSFNRSVNVVPPHPLPANWMTYVGIDFGSGGPNNHPSTIVFVGVSPCWTKARVYKSWKGYQDRSTTQGDVIEKYIEMAQGITPTGIHYDYSAKDLGTIAERKGLPFRNANKSHDGIGLVDSLLKYGQLKIYEGVGDNDDLAFELQNLADAKNVDNDDLSDALRYAFTNVPMMILTKQDPDIKEKLEDKPKKEVRKKSRREMFYEGSLFPKEDNNDPLLHDVMRLHGR